ncbi:hypothetical protein ACV3J7_19695 [Salmonella enterica]
MLIYFIVSCIVIVIALFIAVSKINEYNYKIAKHLESQIEHVNTLNKRNINHLDDELSYLKAVQDKVLESVLMSECMSKKLWVADENKNRLLQAIDGKVSDVLNDLPYSNLIPEEEMLDGLDNIQLDIEDKAQKIKDDALI